MGSQGPPRLGGDERGGRVARLFGSLANTLLDLGLPRIRVWLREHLGPNADVERVSTEGGLIHLDGVRLPIGPRGELLLERATATITPARGLAAPLPEVRLQAFRGVLSFTGAGQLRAEVAFVATPDADAEAWVAGELTILHATWSVPNARTSELAPTPAPMAGRVALVVTSSGWSLDEGVLTREQASVRFALRGPTEAAEGPTAAAGGVIEAASLVLDGARVGPLVDALQAMMGRPLAIPRGVPLDARLEGTLAWDVATGGQCALGITAHGLAARLTAEVGPDGRGLAARASGELAPCVTMRSVGVADALLPRAEDRVAFVVEASGDAARPDVQATFRANELGFRFGRPRFQPALVARAIEIVVDTQAGNVANVRASARFGAGALAVDGALAVAKDGARGLTLRATDLEPSWVVPVIGALAGSSALRTEDDATAAATLAIPRDARFNAEVVLDLRATSMSGHVTMTTPHSAISLRPLVVRGGALEGTRLHGRVAIADALRMNVFPSVVRPAAQGTLDVDLAVSGVAPALVLRGMVAAPQIRIAIATRPDVPPFLLQDASASLALDSTSLVLRELRCSGYGGVLTGEATLLFVAPAQAPPPALALACHDMHASFVEALARLARGNSKVRAEHGGPRPAGELWIPRDARVSGKATLGANLAFCATTTLTVPSAAPAAVPTSLTLVFRLAPDLRVDGSTLRGTLAIGDALTAGAFDAGLRPLPEGSARLEVRLMGPVDECTLSGFVSSPRVRVARHQGPGLGAAGPVFVVTDLSALFRVDGSKIVWHRLAARAYGGTIASAGVIGRGGAFVGIQATLAVRALSVGYLPVDEGGRTLSEMARGRVAVDMRLERQGAGPVVGRGDLRLDEGAFPVLARSKVALAKYGSSGTSWRRGPTGMKSTPASKPTAAASSATALASGAPPLTSRASPGCDLAGAGRLRRTALCGEDAPGSARMTRMTVRR